MDYSKLSDQEINMAVAAIIHPESTVIESKSRPPCACITGQLPSYWADYCNNAADAWPIISQNKITLHAPMSYDDPQEWLCFAANDSDADCMNTNPLRAAMIVFLMMQESANVQDNTA